MAVLGKNMQGYGYKYTDLAAINEYIESLGETYYQFIETDEHGNDYIVTVREKNGNEIRRIRGCRIIPAALSGQKNPVQEYGAGITYIRRYSLLMAYGLATEDNDAAEFNQGEKKPVSKNDNKKPAVKVSEPKLSVGEQDIINILLEENELDAMELFRKPVEELYKKDFDRAQKLILKNSKA